VTGPSSWETATVTDLLLPGVPFPFESSGTPACQASMASGALTLTSGPKSDMFIDPAGDEGARPDAGRWTGLPGENDFTFSARVTVGFASTFDAGVLLLYLSERRWAKLCYEFSPQRKPTAVTVVTRSTSDDSNSFETAGGPLWLRITRSGRVWAFHASTNGAYWQLLRYFTLGEAAPHTGTPTGSHGAHQSATFACACASPRCHGMASQGPPGTFTLPS
jgi:regulation of enolase protein 1 (concanavalin A-like superfamily)